LLLDGDRLVQVAREMLILKEESFEMRCLSRIDSILCGIYIGSIYTAIAGGITSEAIFYHISIPRPLAMASIVFLAELARFLTWLIFIPTAVSRYIESGPLDAALSFPGRIHPGPCGGFLHPGLHSLCQVHSTPIAGAAGFSGLRPGGRSIGIFPGAGNDGSGNRHISRDRRGLDAPLNQASFQ